MNFKQFEATPATELVVSTRIEAMFKHGIGKGYYKGSTITIGDIVKASDKEILETPNIGKKSLKELRLAVEAYATQNGICLSDFKGLQRRLYDLLVEGLEMLGDSRMAEELMETCKSAKQAVQIKKDIRNVLETINPSETPFMTVKSNSETNLYAWPMS